LQMSFDTPSPAVAGIEFQPSSASSKSSPASSAFSYYATSIKSLVIPTSGVFKIHRQSPPAQASEQNTLALLPPPTRPQKFVQMKPRRKREEAPNKRRLSSTRAADRKIARKTAHSLIEQRRRSKMNTTFGFLKNMIPACTGEMRKLDILQVGDGTLLFIPLLITRHRHASTT
jgi:hypothetical protein